MKCDELTDYRIPTRSGNFCHCYFKKDVDAAIDELKTKHHRERHEYIEMAAMLRRENAELKAKLEDAQASAYAESVDAGMRERRLRRTLWIARAERALEKIAWFKLWNASISTMNPEDGTRQEFDKWKKNLGKFLKKAEEYK